MIRKSLLLLLFSTACFGMNGFYQIGYGAQSKGMGGVGVALPQDALVSAMNPAGIATLKTRLDVGGDWIRLGGSMQVHDSMIPGGNGRFATAENLFAPEIGFVFSSRRCISAGIAYYLLGEFDVDTSRPLLAYGITPLRREYRAYAITPSIAMTLCDDQSVGIAANIVYGRALFGGFEEFAPFSENPAFVTNRERQTRWGGSIRFGWMAEFFSLLNVGLTYQTPTWIGKFSDYSGLIPDGGNLSLPSMVMAGIGISVPTVFSFGFDLGWIFSSESRAFHNNANTIEPFGSRHGPGWGWTDQLIIKIGASYQPNECLIFRAGYNYGHAPFAPSQVNTNVMTLATPEHHITMGATLMRACYSFTIAYIHGFTNRICGEIPDGPFVGERSLRGHHDQVTLSVSRSF